MIAYTAALECFPTEITVTHRDAIQMHKSEASLQAPVCLSSHLPLHPIDRIMGVGLSWAEARKQHAFVQACGAVGGARQQEPNQKPKTKMN